MDKEERNEAKGERKGVDTMISSTSMIILMTIITDPTGAHFYRSQYFYFVLLGNGKGGGT